MSNHLSGEAGIIRHIPQSENTAQQDQILDESQNTADRLCGNRWINAVVAGTIALGLVVTPELNEQPASAETVQAVVGMPFQGRWAWNRVINPPYTDDNSSHPSVHASYGFDWATDLYAAENTAVKVFGSSPHGTVTFRRNSISDTCSSHGPGIAGKGVTFDVLVNANKVGEVKYDHLDLEDVGSSPISNGTKIGEVTSESLHSSCFQSRHAHVQFKNTTGNHSCYANHGNAGVSLNAGDYLGTLGSVNPAARQACDSIPSTPPPPPPDTDHDGIIDTQDQCPTMSGIPGLGGCPPKDIDRDGIADLVIIDTANTGSGVTEAHELSGSGGYVNWFGHQATAVGYLNPNTQQVLVGDVSADHRPDLVVVNTANTSTGKVEVHAMDGANGFSTWIEHAVTPLGYTDPSQKFALADINEDNRDDFVIINTQNTGSGKVEIHALDAATHYTSWLGHWVTPADYLNPNTQQVLVGDANGDKRPDVLVVNTANTSSGLTEVHELNGANGFSTWQAHWLTPVGLLSPTQRLAIGDANADKIADLFIINAANTGSGKVELHSLSGATHYSSWLGHYVVTPLASLDPTQKTMTVG